MEGENILIRIAKCCSPVPGDPIIGFITRGRGLSVHAENCPSVHMLEYDSERMIDVDWDGDKSTTYAVRINLVTRNKAGVLAQITSAIASKEVNIKEANVEIREDKMAYIYFILEITDVIHLGEVMDLIKDIEGVDSVKRGP